MPTKVSDSHRCGGLGSDDVSGSNDTFAKQRLLSEVGFQIRLVTLASLSCLFWQMWNTERERESACLSVRRVVDLFTFLMVFDVAFVAFPEFSLCVCV